MSKPVCPLIVVAVVLFASGHAITGPPGDRIYVVVSEDGAPGDSAVIAFDVDAGGLPTQQESYETGGLGDANCCPQEIVVDHERRLLFVANNESASIAVFSIEDDGTLAAVPGSPFSAGVDPNALAIHPELPILYATHYRETAIGVYSIEVDGALTKIQDVSPTGPFLPADLGVLPGGEYLYAGDLVAGVRGYSISDSGTLTELAGSPFSYPDLERSYSIKIDSDGDRLFLVDLDVGLVVFRVEPDGALDRLSGPTQVRDFTFQIGLFDDVFVYVGIPFEAELAGYEVAANGIPSEIPGSPFPAGFAVTELLEANDPSRLYQVTRGTTSVNAFAVESNGQLTSLGGATVVDPFGRVPVGAAYARAVVSDPRDGVPASGPAGLAITIATLGGAAAYLLTRRRRG